MLRCSSCNHSRWVSARLGRFADDLEWLTGCIPYKCLACGRRGWHRSRRTPPAFDELRRTFPRLSRDGRRFAGAMLGDSLRTTTGKLVSAFAVGLLMGALVFSGATGGADRESVASADRPAPEAIAQVVPAETTADTSPPPEPIPSPTPAVADTRPAATPPTVAANGARRISYWMRVPVGLSG